ncbi:MAG TPA: TlpA disulfide reductase family protein [Ignavibacteriales bacterium]|nr:TlpA disulfide reductase family protein [Ignavibacteriales bacterium]HOL80469.1 TlpA disulfide reductase family protein [Ignavibacteriales bacterium]
MKTNSEKEYQKRLDELKKLPKWRQFYMMYKNPIYTTIFFVVVIIFYFVNNSNANENASGAYPPGYEIYSQKQVDFEIYGTDGKVIKLSNYKNKVVLIDFWATWCPPCRKSIPDLIALKNEMKDKDFEIIGISLDQQTKPDVVPFIKNNGINYPVGYYNKDVINKFGGVEAIPTIFLVDKKGNVVDKFVGLTDKSILINRITELLKK